ncbi:uncharacterized protein [Argopecten irradians]|uniref:uncharacterized protein isoform X6 n=1 Tax=Argopecten irradians TaxID=31199 RepID=UPI0037245DE6
MAEKRDPKGWVEGLDDESTPQPSDDEEKKSFRDATRKVLQQQRALRAYDDQGPIFAMPQVSRKWSSLIDDTVAFPPKDVERDVSTPLEDRASQDGSSYSDEQEYLPKPEDLYRPTNSPLPNIAEPKPDSPCSTPPPDYRSPDIPDLPMSPPPSYQKFEDKTALATGSRTALATGYQPKFDPAQRPKKKQLYEDSEMPKEEVELIQVAPVATRMSINPRRISYHEEPPIDEGPTRDTYRESSLGATADPIVMDKDISDLPPGVEEKFPPPQSITLSETTSRPERDVERGRREPASETYECTSFGRMNPAFTRVARFTLRRKEGVCSSSTRLLIFIGATLGILSLIVFLGVFPNSFVYVEHYEVCLVKIKLYFIDIDSNSYN